MWSWNVFPSSALWATQFKTHQILQHTSFHQHVEFQTKTNTINSVYTTLSLPLTLSRARPLSPGHVLSNSPPADQSLWSPLYHENCHTVSRVCWHMGLRHGQWRLRICIAWREQSAWWWDECVVCLWRIGSEVRSCTVFWVFRAWQKWWGMVDWGGLGMWNVVIVVVVVVVVVV